MLRSKHLEVDIFLAYGTQQKDRIRLISLHNWFCNWDSSTLIMQLVSNQNLSTVCKKLNPRQTIVSGYVAKHQQQSVTVFLSGSFNSHLRLLNRGNKGGGGEINLPIFSYFFYVTGSMLRTKSWIVSPSCLLLLSKNPTCWIYPQKSRNFRMVSGVFLKLHVY